MLTDAIVDTLIVAAEDDNILHQRESVGLVLIVCDAVGRGEDNLVVISFRLEFLDTAEHWLDLHHHTCLTTKWVVIDRTTLVVGIVSQIVDIYLGVPRLLRTLQNRLIER